LNKTKGGTRYTASPFQYPRHSNQLSFWFSIRCEFPKVGY